MDSLSFHNYIILINISAQKSAPCYVKIVPLSSTISLHRYCYTSWIFNHLCCLFVWAEKYHQRRYLEKIRTKNPFVTSRCKKGGAINSSESVQTLIIKKHPQYQESWHYHHSSKIPKSYCSHKSSSTLSFSGGSLLVIDPAQPLVLTQNIMHFIIISG